MLLDNEFPYTEYTVELAMVFDAPDSMDIPLPLWKADTLAFLILPNEEPL